MKINLELDPKYKILEVLIKTTEISEEVTELMQKLSATDQKILAGFVDDCVELLDTSDIIRFYTEDKKVFAQTKTKNFVLKLRLYELEERLNKSIFVRISNSEIVNIKSIQKIDLSFIGTISIKLSNGLTSYVSRRYIKKIKQLLGI